MPTKNRNQKPNNSDRRRYLRAPKNVAIKLKDKEVDFVTETMNLSCLGAYCQVDAYLPVLTKLRITLLIPRSKSCKATRHIVCEGTVVRVERISDPAEINKYNVAIFFSQIAKGDMKAIDAYVKDHLSCEPAPGSPV